MRKLSLILTVLIAAIAVANPVDIQSVKTIAETQLAIHSQIYKLGARNRIIERITPVYDNDEALCYIAELHPGGYLAISSDTDIRPVIAFSYYHDFDFSDSRFNIAKRMLVQDMRLRREAIPFTSQEVIEENRRLWRDLSILDSRYGIHTTTTIVGPLLDTRWSQSAPYNNLCPIDPETGDRCVVGCTATSMAQVVNYWEFPSSVNFTTEDSYESDSTTPPIWIDATTATMDTIDYNSSGDHPDAANKAGLSWACGVSIYSIYGSEGTIAWFHDSSFTDKWGYIRAEKVDPPEMPEFYDTLQANIMTARPAQLGIFYYDPPDTSGHAIVCDGWMETGEYHLNYGWGGVSDGWYALPEGIPAPFDIVRWAIVNIEPPHRPDAPDDCADAVDITVTETSGIHSDELTAGDEDWFRFHATNESTYVFATSGLTDSYGEIFADCSGEPLIADASSGALENFSIVFFPETTGTYCLRVSRFAETVPFLYNLRYYRTSPPSISLTAPSGGDVVEDESNLVLMWTREGTPDIPAVEIEYSLTGADGPWISIEDSTGNSGLYIWTIPDLDATSHDCYVRISEFGLGRVVGMNDSPFTIIDVSNIEETALLPQDFAISAYPNPFNSAVTISVEQTFLYVQNGGQTGMSSLPWGIEIYDVSGRRIEVIRNYDQPVIARRVQPDEAISYECEKDCFGQSPRNDNAGEFIWHPDPSLGSGVYLVRARFAMLSDRDDGNIATKRVVYLK